MATNAAVDIEALTAVLLGGGGEAPGLGAAPLSQSHAEGPATGKQPSLRVSSDMTLTRWIAAYVFLQSTFTLPDQSIARQGELDPGGPSFASRRAARHPSPRSIMLTHIVEHA